MTEIGQQYVSHNEIQLNGVEMSVLLLFMPSLCISMEFDISDVGGMPPHGPPPGMFDPNQPPPPMFNQPPPGTISTSIQ